MQRQKAMETPQQRLIQNLRTNLESGKENLLWDLLMGEAQELKGGKSHERLQKAAHHQSQGCWKQLTKDKGVIILSCLGR